MTVLEARGVSGGYRTGADILHEIDLTIRDGEIVVIVGPNGAGKSTFMKTVFGLTRVSAGTVYFQGHDITGLPPERIARPGICYVPQERNVFPSLTVQENLEMGAYIRTDDFRPQIERIYALFPRLAERRRQPVGHMSGGEPKFIDETFAQVKRINDTGVGILMVEQNAKQALAIADRGYVFASGRNRYDDDARTMLGNREIAEMFLGG